jgi:cell division protein FtsA
VRGKEVTFVDVEHVIDSAKAVYVPIDREVLHVIPAGYSLDGQNGIRYPLGMIGARLEANVYAITGAATPIQNLLKCCEKAGVEVAELVFAPVASSAAMLTDDERELGVALVDIGGGTTDILLYKDGWPIHASVLAVGGNHFTNDLAVGLKIPVDEAERIKKDFGEASVQMVSDPEHIRIVHAGRERTLLHRHVAEILQARTDEFLDLIQKEFPSGLGYESSLMGVVLTGGGALLNGLDRAAREVWGLPVRADSVAVHDSQGQENNPDYAVAAGLVRYACEAASEALHPGDDVTGVFGRIKDWAKEIFKIHKGGIEYVRN